MQDLQLMIVLFFALKLCLTASRYMNFEIEDHKEKDNQSA